MLTNLIFRVLPARQVDQESILVIRVKAVGEADLRGGARSQVDPVGPGATHRAGVLMTLTLVGDGDLDGLGRVPGHLDPVSDVRKLLLDAEAEVVEIGSPVAQVVGLLADVLTDPSSLGH